MPDAVLIDAIGRQRSKVTLPGYLSGRAPHNKGMRYPADPPRVEEAPLFCFIDGPTRGRSWPATAARGELRTLAARARVRRRFAPHQLRQAHVVELAREGVPINIIQRQLGA